MGIIIDSSLEAIIIEVVQNIYQHAEGIPSVFDFYLVKRDHSYPEEENILVGVISSTGEDYLDTLYDIYKRAKGCKRKDRGRKLYSSETAESVYKFPLGTTLILLNCAKSMGFTQDYSSPNENFTVQQPAFYFTYTPEIDENKLRAYLSRC